MSDNSLKLVTHWLKRDESVFSSFIYYTFIYYLHTYSCALTMGELLFFDMSNEHYSCAKNVSYFQNARYNKIISLLRKSVCFQNLQLSECLFKNNVASFVNPAFSKIPGCRNYMPKFCRFGIIAISPTAATWKLNNAWVIDRGNGELKTERSTR